MSESCPIIEEESVIAFVPLFSDALFYTPPQGTNIPSIKLKLRQKAQEGILLFADNVWPGARVLADYLATHPEICQGPTIELGAGCALPSLVAYFCGSANLVITDYPEESIIDNIIEVFSLNGIHGNDRVKVCGYIWGDSPGSLLNLNNQEEYRLIILSEVLWKDTYCLHTSLALSVISLLAKDGVVILTLVHRPTTGHTSEKDLQFITLLIGYGLKITIQETVKTHDVDCSEDSVHVFLYILQY